MPELEIPVPRESALICWPVLWDEVNEGTAPKVENIHVTCVYWPGYGEADQPPLKDRLQAVFAEWPGIYRGYTNIKVEGPDAFGAEYNYPVLTVARGFYTRGLAMQHRSITNALKRYQFDNYDQRFEFNPHCSVDLRTVLDPPKRLILGPLELWYKDDEPVRL